MGACRFLHWLPPDDGTGKYSFTKKALTVACWIRSTDTRNCIITSRIEILGRAARRLLVGRAQSTMDSMWAQFPHRKGALEDIRWCSDLCCQLQQFSGVSSCELADAMDVVCRHTQCYLQKGSKDVVLGYQYCSNLFITGDAWLPVCGYA